MKPIVELDRDDPGYMKAYYEANKERLKEQKKAYYEKNKQAFKDKAKKWKKENPEKLSASNAKRCKVERKKQWLKQAYGLTWDEFLAMHDTQGGGCKICRKPLSLLSQAGNNVACVDHNHTTGKVRGLLCNQCNRGIGYLQDSSTVLRLAAEYLDESNSQPGS